jgi:transposase
MFIRLKQTKSTPVLQLLKSFRDVEGKPRQKVILSMGNANIPKQLWTEISKGVHDRLTGQLNMFNHTSTEVSEWIDIILRRIETGECSTRITHKDKCRGITVTDDTTIDGVVLNKIKHADTTSLGPSLIAKYAWDQLKMPKLLTELQLNPTEQKALAINVMNRLIDPVSENKLLDWQLTSSLPELLGQDFLPSSKDRFYRVCDKALKHKTAIETHLRKREEEYFGLERTILLYDLTNTYFEGTAKKNPKAKRGNSKEKRHDCPQLVVGVVFDRYGFELAHEIFAGNQSDSTSMVTMVKRLEEVAQADLTTNQKPLVIIDGGIATKENRKMLKDADIDFLANDSRPGRKKYADYFEDVKSFTEIPGRKKSEKVLVRSMKDPLADEGEDADTIILCQSAGRGDKEKAMLSNAEERFIEHAGKLVKRVEDKKLVQPEKIERAIGRLLQKHSRVSRYYEIKLVITDDIKKVEVKRNDSSFEEAEDLHGCYILRTCSTEIHDASEWWQIYIMLTRAENGFRMLKRDLGLRPVRHHKEDRGDSHIFISIIAYHLLQFITHKLSLKDDCRSWNTIKRIVSTHSYTTVILPTKSGETYRVRKPGEPGSRQINIYNSLGVNWKNLPETYFSS